MIEVCHQVKVFSLLGESKQTKPEKAGCIFPGRLRWRLTNTAFPGISEALAEVSIVPPALSIAINQFGWVFAKPYDILPQRLGLAVRQ